MREKDIQRILGIPVSVLKILRKQKRERQRITGRGVAVLTDAVTGEIKRVIHGKNIVGNVGDVYYAQVGAQESPTNDFTAGGMKLGTGTTAAAKTDTDIETDLGASYKAIFAGYPKSNDAESGIGGTDKVTYKVYWDTTEANANNIAEVVIVTDGGAPPAGGLLTRLIFAATFNKTAAECLTVYISHEFDGQ